MRTCALSYQIFLMNPVLSTYKVVGSIIWCDNPQVRMWIIFIINNNDTLHLRKSQKCSGTGYYVFYYFWTVGTLCRTIGKCITYYHILICILCFMDLTGCNSLTTLRLCPSKLRLCIILQIYFNNTFEIYFSQYCIRIPSEPDRSKLNTWL